MPGGNWPAPLAFYARTDRIALGADAQHAAQSHTPGAFRGYFENLPKGFSYPMGGTEKDFRYILIDAIEQVLERFLKQTLFEYNPISDYRAEMPLIVVCEADVQPNERALLKRLLTEAGYEKAKVIEYGPFVRHFVVKDLAERFTYSHTVVGWSNGNDLYLSLVSQNSPDESVSSCLVGLGTDPTEKTVGEVLWRRFSGQNTWLTHDDAEAQIKSITAEFLRSTEPIKSGSVTLRDGQTYHYDLNRAEIESAAPAELPQLRRKVSDFLLTHGISDRSKALLILRGNLAHSRYFERALSPGFGMVLPTSPTLREGVMKLIISTPDVVSQPTPPTVEPEPPKIETPPAPPSPSPEEVEKLQRMWRLLKPELRAAITNGRRQEAFDRAVELRTICEDALVSEVVTLINNFIKKHDLPGVTEPTPKPTPTPEPPAPPVDAKELEKYRRDWRQLKAELRAEFNNGRYANARSRALNARGEMGKLGLTEIVADIDKFLAKYQAAEQQSKTVTTGSGRTQSPSSNEAEGERLIKERKLKEALKWYRLKGDNHKAEVLQRIVTTEGFIKAYQVTFEASRQGKSATDITRRIDDISAFIKLCKEVNLDVTDYQELLKKYKTIKTSIH